MRLRFSPSSSLLRRRLPRRAPALTAAVVAAVAALAACTPEPEPRSYHFFMEDSIARDGVLARCNLDRKAAQHDIECANARSAATAVQLHQERAQREALERESERKLEALRQQVEAQQLAAKEAARAAAEAAAAAYDAQWREDFDPTAVAGDVVDAADAADEAGAANAPGAANAASAVTATAEKTSPAALPSSDGTTLRQPLIDAIEGSGAIGASTALSSEAPRSVP